MTREDAISWAKTDMREYNCEAYAVWHYDDPSAYLMQVMGKNYDPEYDYDYAVFPTTDELHNSSIINTGMIILTAVSSFMKSTALPTYTARVKLSSYKPMFHVKHFSQKGQTI